MSIEVDWETATSGPDGEVLAERIRSFIHDKFQQVALPRFIRSVQVHSFDFGTVAPELEIKDFCEPFEDFYEETDEDDEPDSDVVEPSSLSEDGSQSDYQDSPSSQQMHPLYHHPNHHHHHHLDYSHHHLYGADPSQSSFAPLRTPIPLGDHLNTPFLPRAAATPGIPGGTANLGYHLMSLGGGLSGTQTPLGVVASGNPFASTWPDSALRSRTAGDRQRQARGGDRDNMPLHSSGPHQHQHQQRSEPDTDNSSASRPSTANTLLTAHNSADSSSPAAPNSNSSAGAHAPQGRNQAMDFVPHPFTSTRRLRERRPDDFQVLCRVNYAGDIKLSLTAEILLDYPMPSFVGLPLKLNVTGITFDGVAVLAYIRKRIHLCFLSPEDADAWIGWSDGHNAQQTQHQQHQTQHQTAQEKDEGGRAPQSKHQKRAPGGLLQEIRVESEIGRKEGGKQVLKNVGKVERFVLAQVRRIFEEEFVYPSFWTFLI